MSKHPNRLQSFATHHVSLPLGQPRITGSHRLEAIENVLVELHTPELVGIGYAFCFEKRQAQAIRAMITDLAEAIVDQDATSFQALWEQLHKRLNLVGDTGIGLLALAAIDTALWDIHAKSVGLPLYRLLGGVHTPLPVYATAGFLSDSVDTLIDLAERLKRAGHRVLKVKVGHSDPAIDIDRVRLLIDAVGDSMRILVDANQAWSPCQAIMAGRAFQELGVGWLEEPVAANDLAGSAKVAAALDMPVAAGESSFGVDGHLSLIRARSADVLMPDLMRCGGPTGFLKVAAVTDAYHISISSHVFTEVSVHLMAACGNANLVEDVPGWWDDLFENRPTVVDGAIRPVEAAGVGLFPRAETLRSRAVT